MGLDISALKEATDSCHRRLKTSAQLLGQSLRSEYGSRVGGKFPPRDREQHWIVLSEVHIWDPLLRLHGREATRSAEERFDSETGLDENLPCVSARITPPVVTS